MRLLTRFDFDGICCAVLLKELELMDEIKFIHPKELQDGNVEVTANDILANVPFVEGCGLWFDHHTSEEERVGLDGRFKGASHKAPSAARVIYDYYDGSNRLSKFNEMMKFVDLADSAQFTVDDIMKPKGWVLLAFICDPRTGLSFYDGYGISQFQFMNELIEKIRTINNIDRILQLPDVKERVDRYFQQDKVFRNFLIENSHIDGPAVITDTRSNSNIPPGNRFLVYSLFPETNISIRLIDGKKKKNVVIAVGHSIINKSSRVNVGSLMLRYGGGGHERVGTCQIPYEVADTVLKDIVKEIKEQS